MPIHKSRIQPLLHIVLFVLVTYSVTLPALAAALSGRIAVIDIKLDVPLVTADLGGKISGTINVFEQHQTPLTSKGALDLTLIRNSRAALSQRIKIERRGSSSLGYPKKNYSLDLESKAIVLGMPAEKEWIMHSCWADKTCLRNLMGYWQANRLSSGSPRTEYAEVFINNEYRGLYLITEKIKLGATRVNLPAVDTNNVTGTYIFKRDGDDSGWDWASTVDSITNWWLVQPKRKNITPAQLTYLSGFMNNTVEPMFNPLSTHYNPTQYAATFNPEAAINFMIMHELGNSVDAYWKSMYITKRRNNRLYMGPIWDLDLSFANANIAPETCQTDTWRIETSELAAQHPFRPLTEMWKVPAFKKAFKSHWNNLRDKNVISPAMIKAKLMATASRIKAARARDDKKWQTIGKVVWWECTVKPSYATEVAELNRWMTTRINWMDKKILNF